MSEERLLRAASKDITPENIVMEMHKSRNVWNADCPAIKKINDKLRTLERARTNHT